MLVTDIFPEKGLGLNRQNYKQLKLALSLGLRRQIFLAVCDDMRLRNQLARRLETEVGDRGGSSPEGEFVVTPLRSRRYPGVVSIQLDLADPNPYAAIAEWLERNPPPTERSPMPVFQILGIEHLTRHSTSVQWFFLNQLREIELRLVETSVPRIGECSLLLWVPRPWCHTIQQSAPEFWRCRTGVFEFEGDPTPIDERRESDRAPRRVIPMPQRVEAPKTAKEKEDGETAIAHSGPEAGSENREVAELEASPGSAPSPAEKPAIASLLLPIGQPASPGESEEAPPEIPTPSVASAPPAKLIQWVRETCLSQTSENVNDISKKSETFSVPLQLLDRLKQLHAQSASAVELADTYFKLGNFYRELLTPSGEGKGKSEVSPSASREYNSQYLEIAILAYDRVLALLEPDNPLWADLTNDLGNFYWMRARSGENSEEKIADLERAIEVYRRGLNPLAGQKQSESWGRIQNNLGAVYGEMARYGSRVENLQRSIAAYNEALNCRKGALESDPPANARAYAATQNNLGTAYWNLAQHCEPVANLHQAIGAYSEALRHHSREEQPREYGMIQNNLGTAYWNLAQYERPADYLMLAVAAYEIALIYRNAKEMPAACAATQNNLGTAYWHLANHSKADPGLRGEFLREAIAAYDAALAIVETLVQASRVGEGRAPMLAFDRFAAHNNLGIAHYQLVSETGTVTEEKERSQHLEAALHHHLQALQGWQQQPQLHQTALHYVVQTIRTFYREFGIAGQNLALAKVPGELLPELLRKL
ncbi:tetratricopeptide repeat protein [Phormidium sp. CCY1219]|uniref:tetratricopeptide repeat protein n=1 Tax=Phormidium sp. CCY1219 TaxID=2886104 RepID=UPI002D1EF699|nr:hypothetical protein [Phormidium sp. CCY1219]MEB3831545.1 tetratricopeptide repeat protein [Phormidium sp. CCY1219]